MLTAEEWKFVLTALQHVRASIARSGAKATYPAVQAAHVKQLEAVYDLIRKVSQYEMEVRREGEATRKR